MSPTSEAEMQISPVLRRTTQGLVFYCMGCKARHQIYLDGNGARWSWDGNAEEPTFSPSVLVESIRHDLTPAQWEEYDTICSQQGMAAAMNHPVYGWRCHTFIRGGYIEYLDDCSHTLRGRHKMQPFGTEEGAYT